MDATKTADSVSKKSGITGTVIMGDYLVRRELTSEGLVTQTIDSQDFAGRPIRGNSLTSTRQCNTRSSDNSENSLNNIIFSLGFGAKAALILGLGFEGGILIDKDKGSCLYISGSIGCGIQTPAITETNLSPAQYMGKALSRTRGVSFDPIQTGTSSSTTADICLGLIGTYDLNNTNSSGLPNSWSFGSIGGGVWKTGTYVRPLFNNGGQ